MALTAQFGDHSVVLWNRSRLFSDRCPQILVCSLRRGIFGRRVALNMFGGRVQRGVPTATTQLSGLLYRPLEDSSERRRAMALAMLRKSDAGGSEKSPCLIARRRLASTREACDKPSSLVPRHEDRPVTAGTWVRTQRNKLGILR